MNRKSVSFCFLAVGLAALAGCSGGPPDTQSKQAAVPLDKIQGKAQIVLSETTATDSALNAGGPSVYLWKGLQRYRLFFRTPTQIDGGKEYIAEGVEAQKAIDAIGDPDQGKNGYPLQASCARVVKTAWPGLAFDVTDGHVATLRARIQRYPARPVFLVTRLTPVEAKDGDEAKKSAADEKMATVQVPAEKQKELLVSAPAAQTAPLWSPAGGTMNCRVVIGGDGKVEALATGIQLCEAARWEEYQYKPRLQGGHPVKVDTEVEVRFEPRK